jgi:hypothetical protein
MVRSNSKFVKKNSPYMITQTLEIPENIELIIEPGVEIRSSIQTVFLINGILTVNGTLQERVIFTGNPGVYFSTNDAPRLGSNVDINYAVFTGANYLLYRSGNTPFSVRNSEIVNIKNQTYIWYPTGSMTIEKNIFRNSGGITLGFDGRTSSKNPAKSIAIRNNLFVGKPTNGYWVECWVSYGDTLKVYGNTFYGGPYNAVQVKPGYDSAFLDASSNFWGTTNSQEIAAMVLDSSDSIQYKSAISTANALSSADPNTPAISTALVAERYLGSAIGTLGDELKKKIEDSNREVLELQNKIKLSEEAAKKQEEAEAQKQSEAEAKKQESAAKKQEAADKKQEAATKKSEQEKIVENDLELDGEGEDPTGDVAVSYQSSTKKYLISISSNLGEENLVLRATKKGTKTLQYKVSTNGEGNAKFSTKNILKGFTMTLLFNGERLDSFRIK